MKTPTGYVTPLGRRRRVRITYTDPTTGKRKDKTRIVDSAAAAQDLLRDWQRQLKESGVIVDREQPKSAGQTFSDLADHYEQRYAKPPEYEGEKKVAGLRGWKTERGRVAHLRRELGSIHLHRLQWADIDDARERLRAGTMEARRGKVMVQTAAIRSLATVNRIVAVCRRMLTVARQRGWMEHNPFEKGDALVSPSLETARDRVMTAEEEGRILATGGKQQAFLRLAVVLAVETGMRQWEILHLQRRAGVLDPDGVELPWIDWTARVIRIRGKHTKNAQGRIVPLTLRAFDALREHTREQSLSDPAVFGIDSVSTAWERARRLAGCPDLRFHDLRHTAATRMIQRGVPVELVAKILGQKDTQTTRRYVNVDEKIAQEIAGILDAAVMKEESAPVASEAVN